MILFIFLIISLHRFWGIYCVPWTAEAVLCIDVKAGAWRVTIRIKTFLQEKTQKDPHDTSDSVKFK